MRVVGSHRNSSVCVCGKNVLYFCPMTAPDYFIPDRDPRAFYPLRGYLRAPPLHVAEKYIDALTAPGDLVVDPFGALPNVARAALARQRRAIVVESNPLWAWLARALTTLPPAVEMDAALARLGDALKDDTPLRAHINELYTTACAACGKPTPADYFVRAREGGLIARHYTCAHCGATRDDPATEDDLKRAETVSARGMHYHFAFQRVVPAGNLHADRIRKMLDVYTPRNLYALVTLTQKIDARFHATRERGILLLLLLHLLDRGTSFYATPDAEPQLTAHKQFVEFNLWREIELAAHALAQTAPALDLAESPADVLGSPSPEAFIGRGSAKTIAREINAQSAALVLTAPPTRRVAVWALSYLWGAWVLGRAAAQSLAPFLDTQKDAAWEWRWYADTLDESLQAIAGFLRADAFAVFVFAESWHPVIESLLLAAAGAHLRLDSFLFQPRLGDFPRRELDDIAGSYRITFRSSAETLDPAREEISERELPSDDAREPWRPSRENAGVNVARLEKEIRAAAFDAASNILARRGEALAFSWVHHAACAHIARKGLLADALAAKTKTAPGRFVHSAVVAGLSEGYAHDFDHYEGKDQFLWLRRSAELAAPLIDRVEDAVREILSRGAISRDELEDAVYRQFPGDLTPEDGLVALAAAAYADARGGTWAIRAQDTDAARSRALDALARLGERLGYRIIFDFRFSISDSIENQESAIQNFDVVWQANNEIVHAFVWRTRTQFTDLAQVHVAPARGHLIIPENLVALMREKARRLPHLADAFHEAGWHFVRVPFVEKLLKQETIERHDLIFITGLEPPSPERGAQLDLFEEASSK